MRRRRLWGGLLACGVTASLLTSPTSAATSTNGQETTLAASGASSACASGAQETSALSGHAGTAFLTNATTRQGEHFSFYVAAEGAATSSIMRTETVAGCYDAPQPDFARTRVRYTTDPGSATAGTDYTHVTAPTTPNNPDPSVPDQAGWMCNDIHELGCTPPRSPNDPSERPTPVTLLQSPGGDAVKSFRLRLTAAQIDKHDDGPLSAFSIGNTSAQGRSRTVHIVDDDGASRFSLEPTFSDATQAIAYSRTEFGSSTDVWLPVFRAGSSTTATEVDYELVGSGEHPATKGPAGAGATDYTDLTNGTVELPATATNPPLGGDTGPRLSWIKIRLNRDRVGEHPETFDVNLTGHNNEGGATSTTFTILDSDGGPDGDPPGPEIHPKGKLHHPKLNLRYPQNYPYLNEIHLFTQNAKGISYPRDIECPGPHPYCEVRVIFADLAIRKRYKSGRCAWWRGNGFTPGGCNSKHWFRMIDGGGEDYFLYRVKKNLPVSVGKSKVRDYKAWSRWFDASANQSTLRKGANMNLFEVIWGTKACRDKKTRFNRFKCKPERP